MKQKLEIDQKAQRVLNVGLWLIIVLFLILGSVMVSEAKTTSVETEVSGKNPYLKKYKKNQKKMEFKGFKKRKGKYRIK